MRNLLPYVLATLDAEFPSFKLLNVSIEQETVFLLYHSGEELIVRAWSPSTSFRQEVRWDSNFHSVIGFQGNSLDDTALVVMGNGDVFSVILNDGVVIEVGSLETRVLACSWSPDLEIISVYLATGKLLLLSTDFEVISEHQITTEDIKLADTHVSVGWGKRETQFVGKGLKRDPTTQLEIETRQPSSRDIESCTISWRGDGEYFALNHVLNGERVLFTFTRDGQLSSASEPADNLMGFVSWQPKGAVLATVRDTNKVQFFERNGLKRNQFEISSEGGDVKGLEWSSDSNILAVQHAKFVDIYTMKNWHWYRKQRLNLECEEIKWHAEKPATLVCLHQASVSFFTYKFELVSNNDGLTAVIDGNNLLVTPLQFANVPPPMSLASIDLKSQINAVSVKQSGDEIACALANSRVIIVTLKDYELIVTREFENIDARQLTYSSNDDLWALVDNSIVELSDGATTVATSTRPVSLIKSDFYLCSNELYLTKTEQQIADFQQPCIDFFATSSQSFGLSRSGDLIYGATGEVLASNVSSIIGSSTHLLFTTPTKLKFVHLGTIQPHVPKDDASSEQTREIERGSYLVSVIPKAMSVVLQALRGNLETIYPRMLVLGVVRENLKAKDYQNAFRKCKTHRLDMNILYDFDKEQFESMIPDVLKQLKSEASIDLFMSALTDEDVSKTKYRDTSTDIPANEREKIIANKANMLLTKLLPHLTPACQITALCLAKPPQLAKALEVARTPDLVKHLVFLSDANDLYKTALSVYQPRLALSVAQQAQMDPKEYIPFLKSLDELDELPRKFEIDVYLKRYTKALTHLIAQPTASTARILEFVERHELHAEALQQLPEDNNAVNLILESQAKKFMLQSNYEHAGLNFERLGMLKEAVSAYILDQDWKKALSLAPPESKSEISLQIAETCEANKKYDSAAHLYNYFLQDYQRAIECYCQGAQFDDATLIAYTHNLKPELEEQLRESFGIFSELVSDCKRQSKAQLTRLRDLRLQMKMDQLNFANDEVANDMDDALSVATETTNASVFTRYTDKSSTGTADTNTSRRTAKNQRRMERKKARGKKGSVYEEEYLISSTGRLMERLTSSKPEICRLLVALKRQQLSIYSTQLRDSFNELAEFLSENIDEIYTVDDNYLRRYDNFGNEFFLEKPLKPLPLEQIVD